jgi:anti-anti-sigma factor
MGLQISLRHVADVVVVDLQGNATIGHAYDILNKQLHQLIDDETDNILVDLTDITQLDSSSISTIVRAFVSLQHRGASLKFTQICVSVPVTFVRRTAQANTTNDNGIRIAAKRSSTPIEGHSSRHPAPASSAQRIPCSE